ncbi:MAG: hypothetical protein HFJ29_00690 [Clostridia bacterium]|nr:hypothetical protein [Clostridia bacterium]
MDNEIKNIFGDINNIFISKLQRAKNKINNFNEIELFNDCIDTYKRAYKLVENNRLLDGIVLTRNAFELMMMLFGIRIDTNVRKEYCKEDSYERYLERRKINRKEKDYLSQSYLREIILKKYKNIEEEYKKIYNILSKFAHPTIHRNILRFFEREKVDVVLLYLKIIMVLPILFLEILYEEKIIDHNVFQDFVVFKYIIERLTLIYFCNNTDKGKLKKANKYAFLNINKDYYGKMESKIKREIKITEKELKENQTKFKEAIEKLLSKVEYYDIAKKLANLKLVIGD